jgi:hypothetical protein
MADMAHATTKTRIPITISNPREAEELSERLVRALLVMEALRGAPHIQASVARIELSAMLADLMPGGGDPDVLLDLVSKIGAPDAASNAAVSAILRRTTGGGS